MTLRHECPVRARLSQYLSCIYFSIGKPSKAQALWSESDLLGLRSQAMQSLLMGLEASGIALMHNYTSRLDHRFHALLERNSTTSRVKFTRNGEQLEHENSLLSLLLVEAQGAVRLRVPLTDALLAHETTGLDVHQRFYLAVGLAKLGLYDLSLRHVSLIATPWEAPLYHLRAKLIFSPVHASVRALAISVNNFLQSGEDILLRRASSSSPLMTPLCNSFNDAALALQALPLLHLAGYSSPRERLVIGQSPIALPMLLSEVFTSMCPLAPTSAKLSELNHLVSERGISEPAQRRSITVGVVSGSFDGFAGRLMVGLLQSMTSADRQGIKFIAICFPTPRDKMTDLANSAFDGHVNLPSSNKSDAVGRILALSPDVLLFSDAGLDSRVFALAHERIALYQCALWGWGGTIGIPTVDFYFSSELLWRESRCPLLHGGHFDPQELFAEQVILLEGVPSIWTAEPSKKFIDIYKLMQVNFLMPDLSSSHMYLFPGTVTHLHPEFDSVVTLLLKTDPMAIILVAVRRTGRDALPTTHSAIRHDLMHPANAAAAVHKLFDRLRPSLGEDLKRLRVLPPLDDVVYQKLMAIAVAVLDPFPVGVHEPVINALNAGVPVVSAPSLQECTNSHSLSIAKYMLPATAFASIEWPTTTEEYVFLCLQFQAKADMRKLFKTVIRHPHNHGFQISKFMKTLLHVY